MADSWSQLLRPRMKGLKLMGPAVYYLTNPIFAMVSVSRVCLCGLWLGSFGQQVWRTLQSQSKATEGNKSCH